MPLKKISLYCFFIFYLILPDYFALEISGSLPLLTASRMILLLLILCCMHERKVSFELDKFFVLYFIIILLINCYHLTMTPGSAVKGIFSLVFEELVVYIVLKSLIVSKEEIVKGLDLIVRTSSVVNLFALFEMLTGNNLFYYLTTTQRAMLQTSYIRLGVTRASASFGHPVYYSVYAVCMIPIAMCFFEKTNKKLYVLITLLNIMGVVASGTRAALLVMVILFVIAVLTKKFVIKLKYVRPIVLVTPIGIFCVFAIPKLYSFVSGLVVSLLSSVGIMEVKVENFGINANAVGSRFMQFSGLTWLEQKDALWLGLGYDAVKNGLLSYINPTSGNWNVATTIDIAYLGYIFVFGIIGFIAYMILYLSIIVKVLKKSNKKHADIVYKIFKCFYLAYFLCLMTSIGIPSVFVVISVMMYIYVDLDRKEERDEEKSKSRIVRSGT